MRKSSYRSERYRPGTSRHHGSPTTFREQMTDYARGDRLLELRAQRGMSREDVAHELGVTTKSLFTWEKQSGAIKTANAKRIAEFYDVEDWQSLVTRDPESTGPAARGQVSEGFEEFREHVNDIRNDIAELKGLLGEARTEREAIRELLDYQETLLKEIKRVAKGLPADTTLRRLNERLAVDPADLPGATLPDEVADLPADTSQPARRSTRGTGDRRRAG